MDISNDKILEELYFKYRDARCEDEKEKYLNQILENDYLHAILKISINKIMAKYPYESLISFDDLYMASLNKVTSLVEAFDISEKVPFVAYIRTFINYFVSDEIKKFKDIYTSKGVDEKKKVMYHLLELYPNDIEKVKKLFKEETGIIKDSTVSEYIERVLNHKDFLRLDKEIKDDKPQTHISNVVSESLDPEEKLFFEEKEKLIIKYINLLLTPRERDIMLSKMLGADTKELMEKYKCTRQYISKTINSAQVKLKKSNLFDELKKLND